MNAQAITVLLLFSSLVAAPLDRVEINGSPPVPIGGYEILQSNVHYPEIARKAGTTGVVVVEAYVNEVGQVIQAVVVQGIPNTGLNEAAVEGIQHTRFIPARQHGCPTGVWISIPVDFRL